MHLFPLIAIVLPAISCNKFSIVFDFSDGFIGTPVLILSSVTARLRGRAAVVDHDLKGRERERKRVRNVGTFVSNHRRRACTSSRGHL